MKDYAAAVVKSDQAKSQKSVTTVYRIDPLWDPRWAEFVERHPRASMFHTPGWLEALRRTYGYRPVAYTTAPPGCDLLNGIVLCRVYSRITGRRLVSLPFSDHCEPLVERPEELKSLLHSLEHDYAREGWKYVELRPRVACAGLPEGLQQAQLFYLHTIDLTPELEEIFRRFHKNAIQQQIRRAEREGLAYQEGRDEALVDKFYWLHLQTRRRQQLPPHPLEWFRNVVDCLRDSVKIRVASKDGQPIASILTVLVKDVLVYKYGCSDERFHNLGGMHLLFWRTIQEGKRSGAREFDLGRSDSDNPGLITFKERWGATRSQLIYWRYSTGQARHATTGWKMRVAQKIFAAIPDSLLVFAGKALYRHIG